MSARAKGIQVSILSGCLCLLAAESASAAFVARFTTGGALDRSFNGTGYVASVGTLTDTEGVALVTLERALGPATVFAVTVEAERVDAPTSDPVLVASLEN